MLTIKDNYLVEKAKRIRWFGIDRSAKQMGNWENDICKVGYKYQMNIHVIINKTNIFSNSQRSRGIESVANAHIFSEKV